MGFFSDIKDRIFKRHEVRVADASVTTSQAQPTQASNAPTSAPSVAPVQAQPTAAPTQSSLTPAPNAPGAPQGSAPTAQSAGNGQEVDVAAILDQAVKENGQHLDWRKSIVDLMKALGIDSSLTSRKELAQELNYTGSTDDSATMNIWLHKEVIRKLGENGGKVPADLLN